MAFIDEFDPELPLEEQLDFPLRFGEFELNAESVDGCTNFSVKKPKRKSPIYLNPTEAVYLALLMTDGYISIDEFLSVHGPDVERIIVPVIIHNIKAKTGINIKNRWSSPSYPGGYYLGELRNHRNDEKNIRRYNGFSCNVVTGCVQIPTDKYRYLSPLKTKIFGIVMENKHRGVSTQTLFAAVYEVNGPSDVTRNAVKVQISQIRRDLGSNYLSGHPEDFQRTRWVYKLG
jgi:hypothetical protein